MLYEQYGDSGPTIVFLLGANNLPHSYGIFFSKLGKYFKVFVIKYPGINNKYRLEQHTLENYLSYIHQIVEKKITPGKYYLAGFSLGAYLAVEYQKLHRNPKIKGLILLSPMFKMRSKNIVNVALRFILNEVQKFNHDNRKNAHGVFSLKNLSSMSTRIKHTKFALSLPPLTHMITNINYFTILGQKDLIIDADYVRKVTNNKNIFTYKGSGHNCFALESDKTVKLIKDFIQVRKTGE